MGEIEWAMWANEQALISSFLVLIGAILGTIGYKEFKYWQCAALSIALALIIMILEYPRSKRKKGNTIERRYQNILATVVDSLGVFGRNYFIRFLILLLFSIPCCFLIATIMGGMSLIIASFIYLLAAMKGEEWKPTKSRPRAPAGGGVDLTGGLPQPPDQPPPRRPGASTSEGVDGPAAENRV